MIQVIRRIRGQRATIDTYPSDRYVCGEACWTGKTDNMWSGS